MGLAVVEERDEAMVGRMEDLEDNVERLNAIIKETEVCLLQVKKSNCSFLKSRYRFSVFLTRGVLEI